MITLRDYQDDGVVEVRNLYTQAVNNVLLTIPTGGGKTVVFTYIAQQSSKRDKKTLILVHRIELLRQTSKALSEFDVPHGMINPLYTPNLELNTQVASVQTIIKRLNYLAASGWIPDLIIIDECHHATAGSWRKTINHFKELNPKLKTLGVTATPVRSDGQGLGSHHGGIFDKMVIGPTTNWLMENGYLVKAKVLSPPKQFDSSRLKKKRGDYNARDLENLVNKPTITGNAVEHYQKVCPGAPTIVFCVSVKHTEEVAQAFRDKGYKFYAIDGTTDDDTRNRILNGLADGSVQGVCSCDLINEGTDVPSATCAILLRYTQSLSLHIQQIGRVLRPVYAPNTDKTTIEGRLKGIASSSKPHAYILDHVGNIGNWMNGEFVLNHGLPNDERDWSLDGEVKKRGKKKEKEELLRVQQCLSCFTVHAPAPVCPDCGHIYEVRDNKPKQVEGELMEVTAEKVKKKEKRMQVGKARTLDELLAIARERGYKDKWAHIQFNLKQKKLDKIAPPPPKTENEWDLMI